MCVTSGNARLENTYIGAWDIKHPEYGYRHVLAYQNQVTNLENGPNCMLLPIQSAAPIAPDWILDSSNDIDFLHQLYDHLYTGPRSRGFAISANAVIEMGVYHIAILNNLKAGTLEQCLQEIPIEKRPNISPELLDFYKKTYPDYPLLLCCFNSKDAKEASPIMVHYPPKFPNFLMFNLLEAHGGLPQLDYPIVPHQKLICGSYQQQSTLTTFSPNQNYPTLGSFKESVSPHLHPFLPDYGLSFKINEYNYPNKDLVINASAIGHRNLEMDFVILSRNIFALMDKYYPNWTEESDDIYDNPFG